MKKSTQKIMNFITNTPSKEITYINGIINLGGGIKYGTANAEFAKTFVDYFNRLRN